MKIRKGISAVLAGVMALAALPVSAMSASAEGAYALGDVDMAIMKMRWALAVMRGLSVGKKMPCW